VDNEIYIGVIFFQYTNTQSCVDCGASSQAGEGDFQFLQCCSKPNTNEPFSLEDAFISERESQCPSAICNQSVTTKRVNTKLQMQPTECQYLAVSTMNYNRQGDWLIKSTSKLRFFDWNNVLPGVVDVPMRLVAIVMYRGPVQQKIRFERMVHAEDRKKKRENQRVTNVPVFEISQGHYWAMIRSVDDRWMRFDDQHKKMIYQDDFDMLNCDGVIYFLKRRC
jgi:hypothetical protein